MKWITAIIQPHRLEAVKTALTRDTPHETDKEPS